MGIVSIPCSASTQPGMASRKPASSRTSTAAAPPSSQQATLKWEDWKKKLVIDHIGWVKGNLLEKRAHHPLPQRIISITQTQHLNSFLATKINEGKDQASRGRAYFTENPANGSEIIGSHKSQMSF